jgi:hypothetical protein
MSDGKPPEGISGMLKMVVGKVFEQTVGESLSKPSSIGLILLFIVLFFVFLYIGAAVNRGKNNCEILQKNSTLTMLPLDTAEIKNLALKNAFVKTAYNCCCTGDFKNDYVDKCALLNCAKHGVRALDFTIYSLHGKPVISASTLRSTKYKEMYNSLPFSKTMTYVKQLFLYDSANCPNIKDPLFLIFRIQSDKPEIYNDMASSLQEVFGYGNSTKNLLFPPEDLENKTIGSMMGQVVIFIDSIGAKVQSSLTTISFPLGNLSNKIYRESEAYDTLVSGQKPNKEHINILFPDYQTKNNNYDYDTVGIQQGFQFIGLNFQLDDVYLDLYNKKFNKSILKRPDQ